MVMFFTITKRKKGHEFIPYIADVSHDSMKKVLLKFNDIPLNHLIMHYCIFFEQGN